MDYGSLGSQERSLRQATKYFFYSPSTSFGKGRRLTEIAQAIFSGKPLTLKDEVRNWAIIRVDLRGISDKKDGHLPDWK